MWKAIIQTLTVLIGGDGKTVEVVAAVLEGNVSPGMNVEIELNRSLSVSVPIIHVEDLDNNQIKLILDGGDRGCAAFIAALNFADETLVISSPE